MPQNPTAVICCLFPFYSQNFSSRNISKYSACDDYHVIVSDILKAVCSDLSNLYDNNFVSFCDISPIDEKQCAIKSGLGVMGKNGLVINEKYGTYFFIGEIVSDIDISDINITEHELNYCLSCNKCIKACPGGCISENGVDYTNCVSKLTQKKGELSPLEIELLKKGESVWGCDICQDCCPHNNNPTHTHLQAFKDNLQPILTYENMDILIKAKAYGYKGKKLLSRNLEILK